jgi:GTP-binding protein
VSIPVIAIVGAPNVGKSTLFNRLVGGRRSIVTDEPGMTRDRLYGEVRSSARPFLLVDTGGLAPHTDAPFAREIEEQAAIALEEAVGILFVVDARAGVTALDRDIAALLRPRADRVRVIANKIDGPSLDHLAHELHALGLGEPVSISAEHGRGIPDLLDVVDGWLGSEEAEGEEGGAEDRPVRIAIVGRPNVGKSALLNRLLGEDRVMVSDLPGTTRDAVDTLLLRQGRRYLLVDTAGIRRKGKVRQTAELLSVVLARRSIERADVVVLVLDADAGFAAQDAHIAGYARTAYKPLVVAINKWDLPRDREQAARSWTDEIRYRLRFAKQVPIVLVSAKTGQRVEKILETVDRIHDEASVRVPTPELNRWLDDVARSEKASPARGRSVNLLYATQTGVRPPRFLVFCNDPKRVHFSLRGFLDNSLRERFGFGSVPIRLDFRKRRAGGKR